jgi:hypothetical protein
MSVAMETPLSFDEPELALLPKHTKVRSRAFDDFEKHARAEKKHWSFRAVARMCARFHAVCPPSRALRRRLLLSAVPAGPRDGE